MAPVNNSIISNNVKGHLERLHVFEAIMVTLDCPT